MACRTLFVVGDSDNGEQEEKRETTLVEAIKEKYCNGPEEIYDLDTALPLIKETSPKNKPGAIPVEQQKYIVLDDKNISGSGSSDELSTLCTSITDLHIPKNLIKDWDPICTILASMPSLQHLNLVKNDLSKATMLSMSLLPHVSLSCLHLSCTCAPFNAIVSLLSVLPNLNELHLSCNLYTDNDLMIANNGVTHKGLTFLYLVENNITEWSSIESLSEIFPNLISLSLNTNPLSNIQPTPGGSKFKYLQTLNLNESSINLWDSVENLSCYSELKNLSLLRVPVGESMVEKERRYSTIARLPSIENLNKSYVSEDERLDAERWLIREYNDKVERPLVYQSLLEKHGNLEPLVEVNLSPKKSAYLEFHYEGIDRACEKLVVNITMTTKQFRCWIGRSILVPPSKLRLFYIDIDMREYCGAVEMRWDSKILYTYGIKDGDQIDVVVKQ